MYEQNGFIGGTDFDSLRDFQPPPPEKPPEKPELHEDDDDDVAEEEPKTLAEIWNDEPEKAEEEEPAKVESESEEDSEEVEDEEETEEAGDAETEDDAELDQSTPEMTGEEEQIAAVEILDERKQRAQEELDNAKTAAEESEAAAAIAYLEAATEEVGELSGDEPVDEALDKGKEKIETELKSTEPETPEEPAIETTPPEPEIAEIPPLPEPEVAEPDPALPAAAAAAGIPPIPPSGPLGSGPAGPSLPAAETTPDRLPPVPSPAPEREDDRTDRRNNTGRALLAGGLVGYMLGRRRGRIKTEKKLLPIQRKLEKEVADLHGKIAWHEAGIRSLARERAAQDPEASQQIVERIKTKHERKRGDPSESSAENVHAKRPEKFGRFAMNAERPSQSEAFRTPERPKPVDMMTLPELLAIADRIKIQESSVKRLFETNRLDSEGLRRVIRAFLRGERYDQVIAQNLLTPEKYPYPETLQRNAVPADQAQGQGGGWAQSGTPNPADPIQPINPQMDPRFTASHYEQSTQNVQQKTNRTGLIVAVATIAALVLIFILTR